MVAATFLNRSTPVRFSLEECDDASDLALANTTTCCVHIRMVGLAYYW
ncbi:hypothetical protein Q31a_28110 [Aureliella helgolandensis]|uniref:Uncharacterized protein n=1 Tax=Aureliella helgolandensis TaxID=2527968 RepID=A0A518G7D4_9BACT|nr:hypothetical protein Q31a_28110 [Aureliella helgolandensis]